VLEKQRGLTLTLSGEDLKHGCEGLRRIQTDLILEVVEAYQERRMDAFAEALAALRDLSEVAAKLCKDDK
jgi:hypothetical protein